MCVDTKHKIGSFPLGGVVFSIPPALRHKVLCDLGHYGEKWILTQGCIHFEAYTRMDNIYTQKFLINNMHTLPKACYATIHIVKEEI